MENEPPPSYVEAAHGVQLSSQQLTRPEITRVMIYQQWTNIDLQNNMASTDQDQLIVPEHGKDNIECTNGLVVMAIFLRY